MKKQYPQATYQFVEVNPSNRIDFLKLEKIDMECGSTTNTATRRNEVNFSTPFYYASIVALKLKSNPITSIADVDENSKVIYTEKTTTEQALAGASRVFENKSTRNVYQRVIGKTYDQSFDLLTSGAGDFFAADDILLFSLKEKSKNPENYVFLKDKFSIEPYGIMTRKSDSWLTTIVDKTIIGMMRNGEFNELYDKWFMKPISPSNKALNIPMSRLLKDNVRMPSNIVGN
ncbi:MAG: hypothetical protein C0175_03920 [Caldisericum exile]|uniref:Solute-binding protein family 3/N-terminal domain-containing protein n=1 Tax=Caldisericum exile TaxID=693075 RepID=A0A2J6X681_9BACT|nr:MAG: hypothetical protein C0175_03920 [Caldisericum exile]